MKITKIVICLFLAIFLVGCSITSSETSNTNMPKDFGFTLKYGIGAKNIIDTFEGTYEKDLVTAGTTKTKLRLTNEEMATIYNKMQLIDVLDYPESYAPAYSDNPEPGIERFVTPNSTYFLYLAMDGRSKTISWNDINGSETIKAKELRSLFNYIDELIRTKEEYKKLPEEVGGYE